VTARPATEKNPFGHGRMEHIALLAMAIFLFVSGLQIGEDAFRQAIDPDELRFGPGLPWILGLTFLVKQWLARFVRYLGERCASECRWRDAPGCRWRSGGEPLLTSPTGGRLHRHPGVGLASLPGL
jgi:divalent metal cation (Fe/Co/Zn/Cd) transporter